MMKTPDIQQYKGRKTVGPLLSFLLMIAAFSACVAEDKGEPAAPPTQYGDVTISVATPKVNTRGLPVEEQDEIHTAEILLFGRGGGSPFVMMASTDLIDDASQADEVIKEFTVRLPGGNYDIVLLANSGKWIRECLPVNTDGIIPAGAPLTLGEVKQALLASVAAGQGWNTNPGSAGYTGLPMIGTADNIMIQTNESNTIGPIPMSRAMAKVDVLLTTDRAKQDFKLHSARVYNYHTRGYLFPEIYLTPGTALIPAPHDQVYRRTVPATQAAKDNLTGELFLFEFNNRFNESQIGVHEKRICLVVGGYYKDDDMLSYYRMDFRLPKVATNPAAGWDYLDVERNTHYIFTISDVLESGWPDEEIAFRGVYRNLVYEVTGWEKIDFPGTPL